MTTFELNTGSLSFKELTELAHLSSWVLIRKSSLYRVKAMARQCMSSTREGALWKSRKHCKSIRLKRVYLLLFTAPGTCDFESGLCGYVHDQNSDFEWTNNTGPTYSSYTGPKGDHTTESGHASTFLSVDLLVRLNGLQRNNLNNTRSVSGKN